MTVSTDKNWWPVTRTRRPQRLAAVLTAGLLAACGTTVPNAASGSLRSDGLTPSGTAAQPGATGSALSSVGGPQVHGATARPQSLQAAGPSLTAAPGAAAGGPAPAAGRVTAPIQIGFLAAASESLVLDGSASATSASSQAATSAVGAKAGTSETPQDAMAYFVRTLNAHGGLAGRKIQVVSAFIDPMKSNYETEAAAACATFTQDHHVAVVFSVEDLYYSESFSACLAKSRVPELVALRGGTDAQTLAKYPLLVSPTAPTVERRYHALVSGLTGNGFLTAKNKVGVVVEDCPYDQAVFTSTIEPDLKAHGMTVNRRDVGCVHGFGDAAAFIGSVQAQVLPLASAGVDRVMFVSGFEGLAAEFFEKQASSQGYRPYYALTTDADAGDNSMAFNAEAMSRVQGVGWAPLYDSAPLLPGGPAAQRCHQMWKGYSPSAERGNMANNQMTCEEFFLLEAGLERDGASSQPTALVSGILGLGTGYDSPLSLGGGTHYGRGRKDGPAEFATYGFKASCTCFVYTSAPRPLA